MVIVKGILSHNDRNKLGLSEMRREKNCREKEPIYKREKGKSNLEDHWKLQLEAWHCIE